MDYHSRLMVMTIPRRRLFPALLLALALLVGQQAAQLHDLSHAIFAVHMGSLDPHPGGDTCEKCSLYVPFSGAASGFIHVLAAVSAPIVTALAACLPALSRTVVHSRSRAPPASA